MTRLKCLAKGTPIIALILILLGCSKPLTVVSYGGGSYQQALKTSFSEPFSRNKSSKVQLVSWNAVYGQLQEMVASDNVSWDVVEVTAAQFERGKRDNLFEKLDLHLNTADYLPGSVDPYGVASVYWSTVLAYPLSDATDRIQPHTWSDFWDVRKFPGKRAMYDDPRGNIEFALLADGVPASEVYAHMDLDRAFRKLDQIKPHILKWWSDGTEPIQLLLTHQVAMTTAWNGRLFASKEARQGVQYSWVGAATDRTYWVIPRGSRHKQLAEEFIEFAASAAPLAEEAKLVGYGPPNLRTMDMLDDTLRIALPTYSQNMAVGFQVDTSWWASHEEQAKLRWLTWKSK